MPVIRDLRDTCGYLKPPPLQERTRALIENELTGPRFGMNLLATQVFVGDAVIENFANAIPPHLAFIRTIWMASYLYV